MRIPKKIRISGVVLAMVVAVLFFVNALGVFDDKPYRAVPHGNHYHYVPIDRDMSVPLDAFPTVPPRPGERILPNGQIVRENPPEN